MEDHLKKFHSCADYTYEIHCSFGIKMSVTMITAMVAEKIRKLLSLKDQQPDRTNSQTACIRQLSAEMLSDPQFSKKLISEEFCTLF